jgi:hypothetical protein
MQKQGSNHGLHNTSLNRPLNSRQIYRKIQSDEYAKDSFLGVFPRDMIPRFIKYPSSFVVNTDPSQAPGQHWLGFYYDVNGIATFFDSFGLSPEFYGFSEYLDKTSVNWGYNKQQLQDNLTSTCGYYAVYFILLKSRGLNLNNVLDFFNTDNFLFNDVKIVNV